MNWEVVAATGEWAGAIAVVITLFYLAMQIRQQNQIARYNAWTTVTEGFCQINKILAENDGILRLFAMAREDISEMTDLEAQKYQQFMTLYFNQMNKAFRAHSAGYLSASEWHDMAKQFGIDSSTVGGKAFRESAEHIFADFWEEMDSHHDDMPGMDHDLSRSRK